MAKRVKVEWLFQQPLNEYNPFDTHGESSFDWKDHNEDGYDDRNDGFWTEKEF